MSLVNPDPIAVVQTLEVALTHLELATKSDPDLVRGLASRLREAERRLQAVRHHSQFVVKRTPGVDGAPDTEEWVPRG